MFLLLINPYLALYSLASLPDRSLVTVFGYQCRVIGFANLGPVECGNRLNSTILRLEGRRKVSETVTVKESKSVSLPFKLEISHALQSTYGFKIQ